MATSVFYIQSISKIQHTVSLVPYFWITEVGFHKASNIFFSIYMFPIFDFGMCFKATYDPWNTYQFNIWIYKQKFY